MPSLTCGCQVECFVTEVQRGSGLADLTRPDAVRVRITFCATHQNAAEIRDLLRKSISPGLTDTERSRAEVLLG